MLVQVKEAGIDTRLRHNENVIETTKVQLVDLGSVERGVSDRGPFLKELDDVHGVLNQKSKIVVLHELNDLVEGTLNKSISLSER